jgi:signal transduction histidine kinase/CheY-like chemotaxis protein
VKESLLRENKKLRKINQALMRRVEESAAQSSTAYGLFQNAVLLEKSIQERTAELSRLNEALLGELDDRTEVAEALRAAKRAAERANVTKTRFLAAVSHDVMQPLNAARLLLDTVSERSHDDQTMKLLQDIDAALHSVDDLLSSLLEIARLDVAPPAIEPRDFSVRRFLERIVAEHSAEARHRRLRLDLIGSEALVRTDPRLLERIVRNLLSNALRYTPTGLVLVAIRKRPTRLRLEVRDSGIGIPREKLAEIFEEFKQLDVSIPRAGAGVGLGLAIVDRLAQLLELPIEVRSREGGGSVFAVEIPYGSGAALPQPETADGSLKADNKPFAGRRAIILGPDLEATDTMSLLFSKWGGEAFTAASTDEALGLIASACSAPDILLADYGAEGLDAVDMLRTRLAREIAAVVTMSDASEEHRRAAKSRNVFVLTKPVHAARLRSLLRHALQ